MRQKMAILKGETAFAEIQKFSDISFYLHKEFPSRQTKGGDVIENVDFPERKQRYRGTQFYKDLILFTQRLQHQQIVKIYH